LIEVAFGEELDVDALRALRSMRLPPLLAPLIGLSDSLALPGEGMMPGFVWLEGGRVVGTASIRRVHPSSSGWLISNVAVHPDWQGQGIGRALLEASLDYAQNYGGTWVVLQVRDNNAVARGMYKNLGFRAIAEVTRLRRPALYKANDTIPGGGLRPARWWDGSALYSLARSLTPYDVLWPDSLNRDLYRTGSLNRLIARLKGYDRRWWIWEKGTQSGPSWAGPRFRAGVGVELDSRAPWYRLRLVVSPKAQDEALARDLITFGLSQLADPSPRPVEVEYPASDTATQSALSEAGFKRAYAFIHMRLDL
jgi:ribosomal protein S18 acetylase RimI-like enzyme